MTTAQLVFLYTAEEGNITRAAERVFISQQCASAHIRNLEDHYGVSLFVRKPKLKLTPAGKSLYDAYREMYLMEQNTEQVMEEMRTGAVGTLRAGMNASRSRILIPEILPRYGKEFPGVSIEFVFRDTKHLVEELRAGRLDVMIGVGLDAEDAEGLEITPLSRDTVHFLTTPAQIREYAPELIDNLTGEDISLHSITSFPLCRNRKHSTLTSLIDRNLLEEGIVLQNRYYISDYNTQLVLCMNNVCSCFCPSMLLQRVRELSRFQNAENRIINFPVREIRDTLAVDLVQMPYSLRPVYVKKFTEYLKEAVQHIQSSYTLFSSERI
jgi:DNA-binding transcriptional LysR family regulator